MHDHKWTGQEDFRTNFIHILETGVFKKLQALIRQFCINASVKSAEEARESLPVGWKTDCYSSETSKTYKTMNELKCAESGLPGTFNNEMNHDSVKRQH